MQPKFVDFSTFIYDVNTLNSYVLCKGLKKYNRNMLTRSSIGFIIRYAILVLNVVELFQCRRGDPYMIANGNFVPYFYGL